MKRACHRGRAHVPGTLGARAAVALALALVGCLDLRGLRERAAPSGSSCGAGVADCSCTGEPSELRLWKLSLGQSDYVTLKNTGECAVELGGLHVFFDDHSELFPDFEIDCLVQLPARTLPPGAEVRVHEDPSDGDIGALESSLSGCGGDVPFNPERGGVTYLCDGRCDEDSVIDAVAFTGEHIGSPPMRFRQTFDAPLEGVLVATQESARFRRAATRGTGPSFLADDWQLETRYLHASFDEGVEVELDGQVQSWSPEPGQSASTTTTADGAIGVASLSLTHRGGDGRSEGIALALTTRQGAPTHVSYFARMDTLPASGAYFDLQSGDFSAIRAGFEGSSLGTEIENGARTEVVVTAGEFHQVELRNVEWPAHRYDLYVDRELVAADLPFWSNAFTVDRLSLYSVSSGSTAGWDEIEAWR